MRIPPHRNQNWPSLSQRSQLLQRNIGGPPISAGSQIWSSLHSFTSFESESIYHLPLHGRNGPYRCGTAIFGCGIVLGTSSHTQQGSRCYQRLLIYYALPVVCTSRYILLAKRSILTKAQVEPMMDILFHCKLYLGPKGLLKTRS